MRLCLPQAELRSAMTTPALEYVPFITPKPVAGQCTFYTCRVSQRHAIAFMLGNGNATYMYIWQAVIALKVLCCCRQQSEQCRTEVSNGLGHGGVSQSRSAMLSLMLRILLGPAVIESSVVVVFCTLCAVIY